MEKAVIGLDIGTSSIKAIVCNYKKEVIYSDSEVLRKDVSDGKEIDSYKLFDCVIKILSRVIKNNKNVDINAIGMSSIFPTIMALDEKLEPLTKIFTWADNRANSIVENFRKNDYEAKKLFKNTGCVIHESYSIWKILWLHDNNKEIFSKAHKYVSLSEFITHKITGKLIVSDSIASTSGLFNTTSKDWDENALNIAGINRSKLSDYHNIYHYEKITNEFTTLIGCQKGTVFVFGGGDGLLCHIGCGALKDKIMSSTIGTSGALRLSSDKLVINNHLLWCYLIDENHYLFGCAINAGFSSLEWFNNLVNQKPFFYDQLNLSNEILENAPFFLPFLDGERGPGYNQNISASFIGLKSSDDKDKIIKSIIEGILFNLYSCYEILVKEKGEPLKIIASGGYINSESMLQMQSDIFNKEICVPNIKHGSAYGASLIALKSIGVINSVIFEAKIEKIFFPNKENNKKYMKRYQKYKIYYELMKEK